MKNILITGCSSGLGFALAKLYLEKGCMVYGISRNSPDIKDENFIFKSFDLPKANSIKEGLTKFVNQIKGIDTVYLNAGMLGEIKSSFEVSADEMKEVYELNVYANKELLDILSNNKVKNIIGISSGAARNGSKGWASYSLSKAGLNMLFNLYSKELLDTKLLAVAPGVVETPMTDVIRFGDLDGEKFPSVKRLKEGDVQTPRQAAVRICDLLENIDRFESGSFVDVRDI